MVGASLTFRLLVRSDATFFLRCLQMSGYTTQTRHTFVTDNIDKTRLSTASVPRGSASLEILGYAVVNSQSSKLRTDKLVTGLSGK